MSKLKNFVRWQLIVGVVVLLAGVVLITFKEELNRYCYSLGLAFIVFGMIAFVAGIIIPILIPDENG
jgi:drug/metabolite transporter (DMT)-like permease